MDKGGDRISVLVEAMIDIYGRRRHGLLGSLSQQQGYLVRQAESIDSGIGNQGSWTA